MKRRALALLCAGILAVGMLAGCGGSSDKKDSSAKTEDTKKEAKSDGTFTVALNYMPNSLQPSAQSSDDLVSAIRPIYEPLFAETKDGLEYYLADKLDISEDGLTYTLHINDKATWSDGEPVTVDEGRKHIVIPFEFRPERWPSNVAARPRTSRKRVGDRYSLEA